MVFLHIVHTKSLMIVRHVKGTKKLQSEMKEVLPQKLLALHSASTANAAFTAYTTDNADTAGMANMPTYFDIWLVLCSHRAGYMTLRASEQILGVYGRGRYLVNSFDYWSTCGAENDKSNNKKNEFPERSCYCHFYRIFVWILISFQDRPVYRCAKSKLKLCQDGRWVRGYDNGCFGSKDCC